MTQHGFFKFPSTGHLFADNAVLGRQDKIIPVEISQLFYAYPVVLEEKVDGANIGFSLSEEGNILVQNRGSYIDHNTHPQFKPLNRWIEDHGNHLFDLLVEDRVLFGEWCYATHSLAYDKLPDWFLAFDIYERRSGKFLSRKIRHEYLKNMDICEVPYLGEEQVDQRKLLKILETRKSELHSGLMEGIYLRLESEEGYLMHRSKVVRPGFVQNINRHWSRNQFTTNLLKPY